MRTTLALDDGLLATAQRLTGTTEKTALVRQARSADGRLAGLLNEGQVMSHSAVVGELSLGSLGRSW